jgi:Uma2 family endonuclease
MTFHPDIIVTDRDGPDVVLVVETAIRDVRSAEGQLKEYMTAMKCPVGILVSPDRLWLYEDRYLDSSAESIRPVANFDVSNVLGFKPSESTHNSELEFEAKVQSWLEGLRTEAGLRELPPDLRRAVREYVDPAISNGPIRAGHPRSFQNA